MESKVDYTGLSEELKNTYDAMFARHREHRAGTPGELWVLLDHELNQVRLNPDAQLAFNQPACVDLAVFAKHFTPSEKIFNNLQLRDGAELRFQSIDSEEQGDATHFSAWGFQYEPHQSLRLLNFRKVDLFDPNKLSALDEQLFNQRQLFGIISHELRTPAATLKMLIDDLEDGASLPGHLPQLRETVDHLLAVLQDMNQAVNPSRALPATKTRFHPNRLLENVHAQMRRMAELADIQLHITLIKNEKLLLESDLQRLKIIALNLIKNAILHSRGTQIWLTAEWQPRAGCGYLKIRVDDDGRGIPEAEREKVFEPFERLDTEADGSGLGLFIVRQSINELNGSVAITRNAKGGASFEVSVPVKNISEAPVTPVFRQESPDTRRLLEKMRILVVEDDPVIRMVSKSLLSKCVEHVDVAEDGLVGYNKVRAGDYDLILSDYFMPVLDGLEMIKKIRADGIHTPIVSVTAAVLGQEAEALLDAGASRVIAKPISMKAFIDLVEQLNITD